VGKFEVANVVLIGLDGHVERHANSSAAILHPACLMLKNRLVQSSSHSKRSLYRQFSYCQPSSRNSEGWGGMMVPPGMTAKVTNLICTTDWLMTCPPASILQLLSKCR